MTNIKLIPEAREYRDQQVYKEYQVGAKSIYLAGKYEITSSWVMYIVRRYK